MNKCPFLIPGLLLVFAASSCKEKISKGDDALVSVRYQEHTFSIVQRSKKVGFGAKSQSAHLLFDQEEVDQWHHTWPLDPAVRAKWPIQTFSEQPDAWTIYVSPKQFSKQQFEQIIACYTARRDSIDQQLKASFDAYDEVQYQVIGRFIHAERPKPQVFKPTAKRYQVYADFGYTKGAGISQEELVIDPNGHWSLELTQTENKRSSSRQVISGHLRHENGQLVFTMPRSDQWAEVAGSIRSDAASQEVYLHSFEDAQGRKISAFLRFEGGD
jgi:hypothetical protein